MSSNYELSSYLQFTHSCLVSAYDDCFICFHRHRASVLLSLMVPRKGILDLLGQVLCYGLKVEVEVGYAATAWL